VKFGLSVGTVGSFADGRVHADVAKAAESGGWDGYFMWDGVSHPYRPVLEPWVGLTVVAAATTNIAIGPMVAAVPNYSPEQLEALVGSLANFAKGRFIFGAGLGDAPGAHTPDRLEKFNAGLKAVRHAHPDVPVWLGSSNPVLVKGPVRRARDWDGLFPMGMDWALEDVATIVAEISVPRDRPFDLALGVTSLAEPDDQRIRAYEQIGVTWLIETILPWHVSPQAAIDRVSRGVIVKRATP